MEPIKEANSKLDMLANLASLGPEVLEVLFEKFGLNKQPGEEQPQEEQQEKEKPVYGLRAGKVAVEEEKEPELVDWVLDHPKSFVTREIRDGKGRVFEVCWYCTSHPKYNKFPVNEEKCSLIEEEELKKDAPDVLERWLKSRKRNHKRICWKVRGILKEEERDGVVGFLVDWGEEYERTWEPRAHLMEDEGVATMVKMFELPSKLPPIDPAMFKEWPTPPLLDGDDDGGDGE